MREGRGLPEHLEQARHEISGIAASLGLDFFDTAFIMCTYEEINMIASFGGFPRRYPHWRFGMEFLRMQKGYEFGLNKIYEMVINTDPAYAYLMDCNEDVDQKLVMAHVFGHVDFFKNNMWFAHTNRKMLDQMANHASRVERLIERWGQSPVEQFIEAGMSIENLIDPHGPFIRRQRPVDEATLDEMSLHGEIGKLPAKDYMEPHINPPEFLLRQRQERQAEIERMRRFPESPERDIIGFVAEHGRMPRWQRQILGILRDEAYYFAPQGQTKIMNEGWASYWHAHIMTRHVLTDSDAITYCDHHSGVVATPPGGFNPYKMGIELWRHIEERWNRGQFGADWLACTDPRERAAIDTGAGLGREKMFEIRRTHNDITFLDTFLTEDFVRDYGLFSTKYDTRTGKWLVDSREFHAVKQQLLQSLAQRGTPRISVIDANAYNRRELLMYHQHDGLDLKMDWAEKVMGNLAHMWGCSVHLRTEEDGEAVQLTHDGSAMTRQACQSSALAT